MAIHINPNGKKIAENILLPGDPLRAKFIAENFLENPVCYNETRGMLGYTGSYKGIQVSVQGTGMGLPSISIYIHELIHSTNVKRMIRVGTCGSYQEKIKLRDLVLANSASTNSSINKRIFKGMDFSPSADFQLLSTAYLISQELEIQPVHVGNILSSDTFYNYDSEEWKLWSKFGVLAAEMESSILYTLASQFNKQALSVLTVSDSLVTMEQTSSEEREKSFNTATKIALETIIRCANS